MGRKGEEGRASSLFVHLGLDSLNRSNARAEPYHHCITMFHTGQLGGQATEDSVETRIYVELRYHAPFSPVELILAPLRFRKTIGREEASPSAGDHGHTFG